MNQTPKINSPSLCNGCSLLQLKLTCILIFLESQFFRVLWENLGVKLSEDEEKALASKYARQDGRTDWRKFCDAINLPFQPNDLACDPICQKVEPLEL